MKKYLEEALLLATVAVAFFAGTQAVQKPETNTETVSKTDEVQADRCWTAVYGSMSDEELVRGDAEVPDYRVAAKGGVK